MMRSGHILKATLLLVALVAVTLALAEPRLASACTIQQRCGSEFYYYSDSTYTVLVGYRAWACHTCEYSSWGQVTSYVEWMPQPCC